MDLPVLAVILVERLTRCGEEVMKGERREFVRRRTIISGRGSVDLAKINYPERKMPELDLRAENAGKE